MAGSQALDPSSPAFLEALSSSGVWSIGARTLGSVLNGDAYIPRDSLTHCTATPEEFHCNLEGLWLIFSIKCLILKWVKQLLQKFYSVAFHMLGNYLLELISVLIFSFYLIILVVIIYKIIINKPAFSHCSVMCLDSQMFTYMWMCLWGLYFDHLMYFFWHYEICHCSYQLTVISMFWLYLSPFFGISLSPYIIFSYLYKFKVFIFHDAVP